MASGKYHKALKNEASTSSLVQEELLKQNVSTYPRPFPLDSPHKAPLARQIRIQKFEQDALRDRIRRIDSRIALNQMTRAKLGSPVSPLIALADEVIRAVFVFICYDAKAASHSPIFLSHIFRHWRTIALDCPDIWSVIRVKGLHSAQLLQLYLGRSRHRPLQGSIDLVTESSTNMAKLTLIILRSSVARFRHLYIKFPDNGFVQSLLEPLRSLKSSRLQTLEIYSDDIKDPSEEKSASFDSRCLHPKSLLIDTLAMLVFCPNIATLVHLQIEGGSTCAMLSYPDLFGILSRSGQNLTCLSIGSEILEQFSSLQSEMVGLVAQYSSGIQLPNLTHLRCADSTFTPIIPWFMTAPKLEVLILKEIPVAKISVPSMSIISPALHTLALINCPTNSKSHGIVRFAEDTENIQHLYILHSSLDKSAFDEMLYQLPEQALWPRLRTLTVDLTKFREYPRQVNSLETLLEMRLRTQRASRPILRVFDQDVELWQTANSASWEEIESITGVEVFTEERRSCAIPWPPRDDRVFISPTSEAEFQI
ncbi:hypothetical protein CPB83DRAFT_854685 [Crepidotus variabilis]|uniref:F-box domain-containing protein n=1 Tax=Crepidotus variabilis TaxID=179855 RepID=A0A9P6EG21_9AGAR|nr:hypothetical protein CPB83DRAFT_854685 [Crepidotus variabilis]